MTTGGRLRGAIALLTLLAALDSSVAAAQGDLDAEGRALFEAGRVAFDAGRYDDALEHFEDAYERSRRPALLYNVGLAADRAGQAPLAIRAYRKFLDTFPDSEQRAEIEARLASLEQTPTPPEPEPEPEPEPVPVTEAPPPTPVSAPPPVVETPQPAPQPAPSRVAPLLTLVGGAVLAVGGLGLIAAAFPKKAEAEESNMYPDAEDANAAAARRSGAGVALFAIGLAAGVTGVIWLQLSKRTRYGVAVGPTSLHFEGRF